MSERTMEGQGRAEQMRAMLAVGGSLSRSIAAMQAAWIEWRHGQGADAAMQWIQNTLDGPGLIPDTAGEQVPDAQAFFDAAIAEIEEHRRGVEAEIAALAAPEPGGEGETLESRAYEVAHWIATEARVAESLGRSVAPIESEGARRIVALASARPTPADVRERVVDEIVSTFRALYPHARGLVAPAAYAAADRIIALLSTPAAPAPGWSEVRERANMLRAVLREHGFEHLRSALVGQRSDAVFYGQWERHKALLRDLLDALDAALLRAPRGEGSELWREVDDLLARLERFEYDAAGESEEYWRVVTIRDRIAAARRGEGGGE